MLRQTYSIKHSFRQSKYSINLKIINRPLKMPSSQPNGHSGDTKINGHAAEINLGDGETFLFTSESVGEGHPGKSLINRVTMTTITYN